MRLVRAKVHPHLEPWIDSIWVFESDVGVPQASSRIIAPNGKAKLILSFENRLDVEHAGGIQVGREGGLHFVGIWDQATTISSPVAASGTIGIEFHPNGVSRFAGFPLALSANRVSDAAEVFGNLGRDLEERLRNESSVARKVHLLQGFLLQRLESTKPVSPVLDYVVERIVASHGSVEVRELEKKTGYSRRWLAKLFEEHIGLSPKTLSAICRFQKVYAAWAQDPSPRILETNPLDLYYDQSHFSREFKRFTGTAPGRYARAENEFGRIFYRRDLS